MKRASKGYTGENIPLFPAMIVQGPVVQGEGSTHPVESYHTPTSTLSTSPPPVSPTFRRTTRQESVVSQPKSPTQTPVVYKTVHEEREETGNGSGGSPRRQDTILRDRPTQTRILPNKRRKIAEIDQDPGISLVQHDAEIHRRYGHDMEFDFDFDAAKEVSTAKKDVSTAKPISTAGAVVTTASDVVSTVSPTRNIGVPTADDITKAETLVYIRKSVAKYKGKGKMAKTETVQTKTKLQQEQERLDFEVAMRLQDELEEEERQRITRRLQAKEREKYTEAEQARMLAELINQRKRYLLHKELKKGGTKHLILGSKENLYCLFYQWHMRGYTLQQLRGYSFDEIKTMFETTMRSVNTFVPIESEVDRAVPELTAVSSKRDAEEELDQESSKRQKTDESSELAKEPKDKEADELSQKELQ
ncbi:hypothetical protein Tco_0640753 [Tanacetum coccineum]